MPTRLEGAAPYSLQNYPEPVMAADFDLSRRITEAEFDRKAREVFVSLDQNHDGLLMREELPVPMAQRAGSQRRGPPPG